MEISALDLEGTVSSDASQVKRYSYALLLALGVLLVLNGCRHGRNEMQQRLLSQELLDLEQKHSWRILVHGINEISYFSPSQGKLVTVYSRFSAPSQTWMGFGSMRGDGRKLAVVTRSPGSPSASLALFDTRSQEQEILLNMPYLFGPRWSPDGERIVFTCRSGEAGNFDLKVYELGSTITSLVVPGELPSGEGYIDWAPDGQSIVYESVTGDVRIVDIHTRDKRTLARGGSPTWSPDGENVASHKEGEDSVTIQNLQSHECRNALARKSHQGKEQKVK